MPTDTSDRSALERAAEHAFAFLKGLDGRPVATTASLAELRARLGRPLADRGVPAIQVIDELVADAEAGILGSQGGRFFSWVIGGGEGERSAAKPCQRLHPATQQESSTPVGRVADSRAVISAADNIWPRSSAASASTASRAYRPSL